MQNLHVRGRLAFGVLLGLAAALPLACNDSDGDDGSAGHGGTAGTAQGGKGGTAQGGKSGSAGAPQGGKGGAPSAGTGAGGNSGSVGVAGAMDQGGATDMGGAGGDISGAGDNGMAGDNSMAGAGGAAPTFAELVEALCSTTSTLDCSTTLDQAGEKAACVDANNGQAEFYEPGCHSEVMALAACLASTPATGFECKDDGQAYPKTATCSDQETALNNCTP